MPARRPIRITRRVTREDIQREVESSAPQESEVVESVTNTSNSAWPGPIIFNNDNSGPLRYVTEPPRRRSRDEAIPQYDDVERDDSDDAPDEPQPYTVRWDDEIISDRSRPHRPSQPVRFRMNGQKLLFYIQQNSTGLRFRISTDRRTYDRVLAQVFLKPKRAPNGDRITLGVLMRSPTNPHMALGAKLVNREGDFIIAERDTEPKEGT